MMYYGIRFGLGNIRTNLSLDYQFRGEDIENLNTGHKIVILV